jgi:hypothetical protein
MIRERFYRQITDRLEEGPDGNTFEACACDVLRRIWPTLVPMPGGKDAGMDGKVAEPDGDAIFLVCTTAKDVKRNLVDSLESHMKVGPGLTWVILATSRPVSATEKGKLEEAADELGFRLEAVYGQQAMANLLRRDPFWCQELLGLSYPPQALTPFPRSLRPSLLVPLIGRDDDLRWLRDSAGDGLLVGQPGIGKTFLLQALVEDGHALFAVTDDCDRLAEAINADAPRTVIVDDAQLLRDLLVDLRNWRDEEKAEFRIVATCWPSHRDQVLRGLGLGRASLRELEPLTSVDMAKVIEATGVRGNYRLIQELIDQAAGKPGLAVTLCLLCLREGVQAIASGDALFSDIKVTFEHVVGKKAIAFLAAFALGGRQGMPLSDVADELHEAYVDVQTVVTELGAGGVIEDMGDRLVVHPEPLREVLVREVFFVGGGSIPYKGLLQHVDADEAAYLLSGVRQRGGGVPYDLLTQLVGNSRSDAVWQRFAALGERETDWLLSTHPGKFATISHIALHTAPRQTVLRLLGQAQATAAGGGERKWSAPNDPLKLLSEWIQDAGATADEALVRRRLLVKVAKEWHREGGDLGVAVQAAVISLSVRLEQVLPVPGDRLSFTIRRGRISDELLPAMRALWTEVRELPGAGGITDWTPIQNLVEDWAYPGRFGPVRDDDASKRMKAFAAEMLRDLVTICEPRPGVVLWVKDLASTLGVDLDVEVDPELNALFPLEGDEGWEEHEQKAVAAAEELVRRWEGGSPDEVVERLLILMGEAEAARRLGSKNGPFYVCRKLAAVSSNPHTWIESLARAGAPVGLVYPFLARAVSLGNPEWSISLEVCTGHSALRSAAVTVVLEAADVSQEDVVGVLRCIDGTCAVDIEVLCGKGTVPETRVRMLLEHEDDRVAAAAAVGEWYAEPKGTVRQELRAPWRAAVVRCVDHSLLQEAFTQDPGLAREWLRRRVETVSEVFWHQESLVEIAVDVVGQEERQVLLDGIPDQWDRRRIIRALVGDDLDLFRHLLACDSLKQHHLAPVKDKRDVEWVEAAVNGGHDPKEIVDAFFGMSYGWVGDESKMWAGWMPTFEALCSHQDPGVRQVGELGLAYVVANRDRALARERRSAVYGHGR